MAIVIALAVLFVSALLSPMARAPFPVNDDWTQAIAVRETLAAGHIFYPAWLSAWSYPQIAFGVALAALFGFSYPLLRATTLVLGLVSVGLLYLWSRRLTKGRFAPAAGAALVLANPIFVFLAFTYQTDVPAFAFWMAAFVLADVAFAASALVPLALAGVAAALSALQRQTGAIALAALFPAAWRAMPAKRLRAVAVLALAALAAAAFAACAARAGWIPGQGGTHLLPLDRHLPGALLGNLWQAALLLSLLVLPASLSLLVANRRWFRSRAFLAALAAAIAAAAVATIRGSYLGALGNVLTPYGFGPTTSVLQGELNPVFGPTALALATFVVAASGAVFAYASSKAGVFAPFRRGAPFALALASAAYLAFVLLVHPFDRYLLPLYPLLALAAAAVLDRLPSSRATFAIAAGALLAFSLAGTSDAFAWRAALWRLGDRVEAQGFAPQEIEGGYERDGDRLYAAESASKTAVAPPSWAPWYVRDLFPDDRMRVILAFSPLGGYGIMDREDAPGFFGTRTIYADLIRPGSLKRGGEE